MEPSIGYADGLTVVQGFELSVESSVDVFQAS